MVFRGGRPSRLSAFSPPPDFLSSPLRWRHGSLSSLYHPRVPGPPSARPAPVPTLRPSDSASVDLADSLHHTTVMRLPASASALIPSSAAAAAEETRLLLGRWAALIQEKGSRSELFVEASASADMAFHVQRVAAKFAPFTLQRYFDSWLNWVSFCRLSGADHLSPLPGLPPDWLRSQSSKQGLSTIQLKSLAWFCKVAGPSPSPLLRSRGGSHSPSV